MYGQREARYNFYADVRKEENGYTILVGGQAANRNTDQWFVAKTPEEVVEIIQHRFTDYFTLWKEKHIKDEQFDFDETIASLKDEIAKLKKEKENEI